MSWYPRKAAKPAARKAGRGLLSSGAAERAAVNMPAVAGCGQRWGNRDVINPVHETVDGFDVKLEAAISVAGSRKQNTCNDALAGGKVTAGVLTP